jgi:hypothetical protein
MQSGTCLLRKSGRCFPGCYPLTETPLRRDVDLSLSGLLGGNLKTVAYGRNHPADTVCQLFLSSLLSHDFFHYAPLSLFPTATEMIPPDHHTIFFAFIWSKERAKGQMCRPVLLTTNFLLMI